MPGLAEQAEARGFLFRRAGGYTPVGLLVSRYCASKRL